MSLWEYKIITSGKGGFASPALLEKFLNDLGREEWEIVQFHTQPDNFLVFTGLARRSTQRDWTLQDAAAAAAKAEAEKLRAEFEAKFKAATTGGGAPAEERPASFLEEKVAPDDGFRKPIDTSRDDEAEDEKEEDDWDKLTAAEEEELPTFFDAIKPHMRRNQRGPGMSVGVDYLAKKWDQSEEDLKGALVECGFVIPADEDAKAEYLEFEGDLYWINVNRRGELWINTKEKPRPVFRAVKAQKVAVEEEQKTESPKPEGNRGEERNRREDRGRKRDEGGERQDASGAAPAVEVQAGEAAAAAGGDSSTPGQPLPTGPELLDKIRPMMRRNRRGPGGSGSASFLSRALKVREAELVEAFKGLGLVVPTNANEKPVNVEIGNGVWWVNVDSRGNVWINGREKKPGETISAATSHESAPAETAPAADPAAVSAAPAEATPVAATADAVPAPETVPAVTVEVAAGASTPAAATNSVLAAIRPLLKETKTGAVAGKLERVADAAAKTPEELQAALVAAGLAVPEKPREKPVFVEHAGEIFWFNRNAKGELWVNAKVSKYADRKSDEESGDGDGEGEAEGDDGGEKKARRPRGRKKAD